MMGAEDKRGLSLLLNCRLIGLHGGPALGGPGEVCDGDDEEAVAVIGDTGEGVVPGQESSEDSKDTTSLDASRVGLSGGCVDVEVSGSQKQEGQVQGEEEEEESDGGFQRADEEDGREDEPALLEVCQRDCSSHNSIELRYIRTIKKKPIES